MFRTLTLLSALLVTISGWLISVPSASAITVKVSINGQESTCNSNPCPIKDFPGPVNFTIQSGQVAWNDAGEDNLDLQNLEVTAGANDVSGMIIFWADDFTSGPDASSQDPKGFYQKGKGTLTNGAGSQGSYNSWVKLTGSVNNDVIVGTFTKAVLCSVPASCGSFNINPPQKETWFSLSGIRKMQGQIEFFLKMSGHKLKLNDGSVPQSVYSGAPAVGRRDKGKIKDEMAERLGVDRPRPMRSKRDCDLSAPVEEGNCDPSWHGAK